MLSTSLGWAGGGIALAGWGVKALTSRDASTKTKVSIGAVTAISVSAATFAALTVAAPSNLVISNVELTMYSTMASQALVATYTGICTALSYACGGSRGEATPQRRTLGLR